MKRRRRLIVFYMQQIHFNRSDKNSVSKETRNTFVKNEWKINILCKILVLENTFKLNDKLHALSMQVIW